MGNNTEFEASIRREMGNDMEFEVIFRQEIGNDTIQDTSFFNEKREKQGKTGKTGEKTLKNRKKNRKLQEIQKRVFDEVPGNAENGNEFGNKFGNEFEVFSNVTKQQFKGKNDTLSHPYCLVKRGHYADFVCSV